MYAYYVVRGHTLESLLSLDYTEKLFYVESMELAIRLENEKYNAMFGSR